MCGIYGALNLTQAPPPSESLLDRMGSVLVHRGPDEEGRYLAPGVALGMRRLSIIDLAGGSQPIANEDKTLWVICNGEIYNFQALRAELVARGHRFRSNSDVEVIVHLYEDEGLDFVARLRGMFAIALWDAARSRLILVRDRLGKKPLYVYRDSRHLLFASEIKCILQDPNVSRRLDVRALHEYLALGYVPAPLTLLEGVEKLPPGHALVAEQGAVSIRQYWDVCFDQSEELPEQAWIERIRAKFLESVRIRLISDVPLGAFLSGGIDSSAIVAAMSQLGSGPVKTYSIGFDGPDAFYNELPYARLVAQAFGTDHHELIVRPDVTTLLPRLIWHMDEPLADSALLTTYLVSQLARQSVTVALSGVGGDELFGGYRRYLGDHLLRYYRVLPRPLRQTWLPRLLAALPQDRHSALDNYLRYASAFVRSAEQSPSRRYMDYVCLFSSDLRSALLKDGGITHGGTGSDAPSPIMAGYFARCTAPASLHRNMYVDIKTSLPDDLLALTDKMTMATSLECRAPFLDHELVELTARMPPSLKVRGLSMKYLLKKVVAPWLPRELLTRPKRGFGAPIGAWLRNDLSALVDDTLSEAQVVKRGLFSWPVVSALLQHHHARRADYTDHLLALVTFELWCRIFLDGTDWPGPAAVVRSARP